MLTRLIAVLATVTVVIFAAFADEGMPRVATTDKVDYSRDVRPILAAKCFACHGQDPKAVAASLRLDRREDAIKRLPSGHTAIVAGNLKASELVARIDSTTALIMPPAASGKTLNAAEKAILKRWISQGAEYRAHWAFIKPVRPNLPKVARKGWVRNGIDSFILSRLEKENLTPSPEADRRTLIRRLSLDLTGLPPTPEEANQFVADTSPKAYEKVVDRLLASPRYGEMMAQAWMDDARYADSNGYQADYERFQWRWRDWVIDAYNRNLPFDQFTIEQLAGDMLPNATTDQRVATGFNRNHRINTEGGIIAEEWRVENIVDRLETVGAVWLGLSIGCGRCHDHKYDPLSQREFYGLFAYFNNVPESGVGEERPVNHPPVVSAPTPEQSTKLARLDSETKELQTKVDQIARANLEKAALWKPDLSAVNSLGTGLVASYHFAGQAAVTPGLPKPKNTGRVRAAAGSDGISLEGGFIDLGAVADFDRADSFSYGARVKTDRPDGALIAKMDGAGVGNRGWDVYLIGGRVAVHLIDTWASNALKVITKAPIPAGKWDHVFVTYDGSAKPEGVKIYVNGVPTPTDTEVNTLTGTFKNKVSVRVGSRDDVGVLQGLVEDVAIYNRVLTVAEVAALASSGPERAILAIAPDQRTEAQRITLSHAWSARFDEGYRSTITRLADAKNDRTAAQAQIPTVMVMDELPTPRDCFILLRGQYDHRGEKVSPIIPAALGTLPAGAPNNRLGFAKWVASPDNPLTSRVAVNRMWERFFGRGIVASSEDFGTRAEFPSHPELLDWLATEFVRLGWDMKAIQKTIVMSGTYRQSSNVTPNLAKRDPENRLFARAARFRLPSEVIRDQSLAVCGLLKEKIGGPSVRPYMPDGVWDETNVYGNLRNYKHDKGDNLYRRTIYTIWKRTAAPPTMMIFDVPGREMCRVRRSRTNTPLQALALMNEVTFVESARVLAQNMIKNGGATPEQRVTWAFEKSVARKPMKLELTTLSQGLIRRLSHYKSHPEQAAKLTATGDAPNDSGLDLAELAAYTLTASVLLNMDETVTRE